MKEEIKICRVPGPANPQDRGNDQGVMICNGQLVTNMPAEILIELGRKMVAMGTLIKNDRNIEQQIFDQAILRRAGAPIGLNANPKVEVEAAKESQWNRDLRRFQKPGVKPIKSTEVFGLPKIKGGA